MGSICNAAAKDCSLISCEEQVSEDQRGSAIVVSRVTPSLGDMTVADSTGNHPAPDGKFYPDGEFYGHGSWEEALEWLGEPNNLSQEGAQNLLVQTIGALHRAVVDRAESLADWRRSELCWRSHRLLLGRERRDDDPDWLAVLEQQLVQCGALLWQQRICIDSEAQQRALELFERLSELIHPCPPWVLLACAELKEQGAEMQRLSLAAALFNAGDQRPELLAVLAACCQRCSREALKEGAWGRALERQVEAQGWLEELAREQPELAQERWQTHALLVYELLDQLFAPLLDSATAERAELIWATHELLEAYRHLPLTAPEWLPALEVRLLQEGAQLWHGLIGEQDRAPERAKALFERLAELSHPQQLLPRRLLMVLGMHRSGTSAVAGHLCSHGFRAPYDTPPADHNNPTGYWESQSIVRLHTELLAEAQSSWDDPFLPAAEEMGADMVTSRAHLAQALAAAFPGEADRSGVALLKDPRHCRWLPLWNSFISAHCIDSAVLLIHRHPMAVLKSLKRREQLPADRILLLWLEHTLEAEFYSRRFRRVIVSYEQFLKNPSATVASVQGLWPDLDFAAKDQEDGVKVEVRPDLNHAKDPFDSSADRINGQLLQLALDVHQTLGASDRPDLQQLDCARQALHDHLYSVMQQLSRMVTLQVFWEPSRDQGFSEENSIRRSVRMSRQTILVGLDFPAPADGIQGLRLDPAETPCLVHVKHVWLRNNSNEIIWQWSSMDQQDISESQAPFVAANDDTKLIDRRHLGAKWLSILSHSYDAALMICPPDDCLSKLKGSCRLEIQAKWEPLSLELASLIA